MHILPCLWCGSNAHDGGHTKCDFFGFSSRPMKWDKQIDALAHYPVTDITRLGQIRRLRMLKQWSFLPKKGKISQVPADPKQFHNIDVDSMPEGVVYSWCAIFDIVVRDAKKARRQLKNKFNYYAKGTIDVHATNVDVSHPYRCSKFPNDNRMALMHTRSLKVNDKDIFSKFGKPCPEDGCNGIIEPDIMG